MIRNHHEGLQADPEKTLKLLQKKLYGQCCYSVERSNKEACLLHVFIIGHWGELYFPLWILSMLFFNVIFVYLPLSLSLHNLCFYFAPKVILLFHLNLCYNVWIQCRNNCSQKPLSKFSVQKLAKMLPYQPYLRSC